ncbi:hypothetical protein C8R44DRAFT_727632 [Mycena epipterygia]|nr:hypothetical protein C8R44DRAFT_727632 [Mycena epipterygia]
MAKIGPKISLVGMLKCEEKTHVCTLPSENRVTRPHFDLQPLGVGGASKGHFAFRVLEQVHQAGVVCRGHNARDGVLYYRPVRVKRCARLFERGGEGRLVSTRDENVVRRRARLSSMQEFKKRASLRDGGARTCPPFRDLPHKVCGVTVNEENARVFKSSLSVLGDCRGLEEEEEEEEGSGTYKLKCKLAIGKRGLRFTAPPLFSFIMLSLVSGIYTHQLKASRSTWPQFEYPNPNFLLQEEMKTAYHLRARPKRRSPGCSPLETRFRREQPHGRSWLLVPGMGPHISGGAWASKRADWRVNWDLHVAGILTQCRCALFWEDWAFSSVVECSTSAELLEGGGGDMRHTTSGLGCRLNFAVASGYLGLAITWLNGSQRLSGIRSFAGVVAARGNLPLRVTVTEALCGWGVLVNQSPVTLSSKLPRPARLSDKPEVLSLPVPPSFVVFPWTSITYQDPVPTPLNASPIPAAPPIPAVPTPNTLAIIIRAIRGDMDKLNTVACRQVPH